MPLTLLPAPPDSKSYLHLCMYSINEEALWQNKLEISHASQILTNDCQIQEFRREGWTEKRLAVRFCLGSGLFGSYNSD